MVGVRFPSPSIAQIDAWADGHGISRSEAIRRLVEVGLAAPAAEAPPERRKAAAPPLNHKKREGHHYAPKPPVSDEMKRKRSDAMKNFNKRTGKVTALGNSMAKRRKPPA